MLSTAMEHCLAVACHQFYSFPQRLDCFYRIIRMNVSLEENLIRNGKLFAFSSRR